MQHRNLATASFTGSRNCILHFGEIRHTGGNNHRPPLPRYPAYEWQIDDLERSDLVSRRLEVREQLNRAIVERCRKQRYAQVARAPEERLVPLERGLRFAIEIIERAAVPKTAGNAKIITVAVDRQRIRCVGLELDRVGTCLSGSLDRLDRALQITVVVR